MQGRGEGRGHGNASATLGHGRNPGKGAGRGRARIENRVCTHCGRKNHTVEMCWDLHGKPPIRGANIAAIESTVTHGENSYSTSSIVAAFD